MQGVWLAVSRPALPFPVPHTWDLANRMSTQEGQSICPHRTWFDLRNGPTHSSPALTGGEAVLKILIYFFKSIAFTSSTEHRSCTQVDSEVPHSCLPGTGFLSHFTCLLRRSHARQHLVALGEHVQQVAVEQKACCHAAAPACRAARLWKCHIQHIRGVHTIY